MRRLLVEVDLVLVLREFLHFCVCQSSLAGHVVHASGLVVEAMPWRAILLLPDLATIAS
eukprot:COSAG02_NODE_5035_length_4707_cov_2.102648_5_plen_59_part_00